MSLTITFKDDEAEAIKSLVPKLKKATDEKEVLLIGLSVLLKSQDREILACTKPSFLANLIGAKDCGDLYRLWRGQR